MYVLDYTEPTQVSILYADTGDYSKWQELTDYWHTVKLETLEKDFEKMGYYFSEERALEKQNEMLKIRAEKEMAKDVMSLQVIFNVNPEAFKEFIKELGGVNPFE